MFSPHETSWDICFLLLHVRCFCPSKLGIPFAYSVTYIYTYIYGYVCVSSEKNGRQTSNNIGVNCKNTAESEHRRLDFFKISSIYWMVDTAVVSQRSLTDPTARYRGRTGLNDWLVGWLVGSLLSWLVGWLFAEWVEKSTDHRHWATDWRADWLVHAWMDGQMDGSAVWLIGWSVDWLNWLMCGVS